ncbi:hypothetical protein KSF_029700 [Reticulibacter mediterranei]|uniref:DUF58 domain-containing protein n=1 Tax=Reticulibacter mediterranei TaxID=2778369 RepID=A0A8J3IKG4_9CHLR|nr:DUF58 domain-containing protein [Reticulibacter mediterranei]GHO92922.1 hypothetical protein KSF_029700 [Reticulibacter mediterranei]
MRQQLSSPTQRRPPHWLRRIGSVTDGRWYLAGVLVVLMGILLHQPLLVILGLLVLLVLGTTDLWARYCLHNLTYQRQFSLQRALFGEEVTLSLTVENAKALPLPWLEVEDTVPRLLSIEDQELRFATQSNAAILECLFSPGWYERVTRRYTVRCMTRGVHTFGPTTLRSGDVFGFISQEVSLDNYQFVLVYPLIVPLTRFGLPARHPFGDRRVPRRLLEDPSRVIGIRGYQYGDELRRIHWKATARTLQLQSKVYETTTTYTLAIFLNLEFRPDVHYGIHPELQELSIAVAASVTDWACENGYAAGLYANTMMFMPDEQISAASLGTGDIHEAVAEQLRRRRIRLPISSNVEQRQRIMEALARVQGYFGSNIEDLIQSERHRLPAGTTIVLITSALSEHLVDQLVYLRQSGHSVAILFVGDTPPPFKLGGLSIYYIGGEAIWKEFVAAHKRRVEGAASELEAVGSLQL